MTTAARAAARQRRLGHLLLFVTAFGWGLNWPAMKLLLRELPPMYARGAAGLAAGLVLGAVALALGQRLRVPPSVAGRLLAAAFLNVFAWMGFATLSLQWLPVGQAALLVYTMPIWALLLAWPLRGERPTARLLAALALSLAGLWLLFGVAGASPLAPGAWAGVGFALASALLFAAGTVALRPPAGVAPLAALAWQLVGGCAPMLLYGLAVEQPRPAAVSATGWALMLYMTVVPMGLCYLTWFAALRRLPATTASLATLVTPVVGVVAAGIVLHEPLGPVQWLAMALTLGGVALALRGRGS